MYGVHIKYNDTHIPGSPFMVNVAPDSGVARQVTVHSLKDKGLAVSLYMGLGVSLHMGLAVSLYTGLVVSLYMGL